MTKPKGRTVHIIRIISIILLSCVFLVAGTAKLTSYAPVVAQFEHFGLPGWFMTTTGVIEISGAVAVAIPYMRWRRLGAAILACTMFVGTGFHLVYDSPMDAAPALLLALTSLGIYASPHAKPSPRLALNA